MKVVDIDKMKEIEAKATPGPWNAQEEHECIMSVEAGEQTICEMLGELDKADAEFIVVAREFVPQAIAEIERLNHKLLEVGQLLLEALQWFTYDGRPESLPEVDTPVIRFAPPNPKHGDRKKFECCYGADLEIGDEWAYFPAPTGKGV